MFATVNGYAYMRGNLNLRWWSVPVLAPLILGAMAVGITKLLLRNVGITYWRDDVLPRYLATIERWKAADPVNASDEQLLDGVRALARVDALYWFAIALAMGTAKSTDVLLDRFLSFAVPGRGLSSARLLRGFGSKVLDAEAELEGIATAIRGSDALRLLVEATPAKRLLDELKRHPNGDSVLEDLNRYFERYGHQIYSLDFAVPTQGEDPLPVLLSLKSLVSSPGRDVRARQAELARERERLAADRARSLGPFRRLLFRRILRAAQRFAPYREESLFYMGAGWPTLRRRAARRAVHVAHVLRHPRTCMVGSVDPPRSRLGHQPHEQLTLLRGTPTPRRALRGGGIAKQSVVLFCSTRWVDQFNRDGVRNIGTPTPRHEPVSRWPWEEIPLRNPFGTCD
jgi:rifampicin phosphotransferase